MEEIIYGVTLAGLVVGSYTDIQRREVPDWINYGLVITGFGLNSSAAILQASWQPILNSIAGFALFFSLAWLMFYTGQWGGGDSKMLMALGVLLGLPVQWPLSKMFFAWQQHPPILLITLIALMVCGAVYGLVWMFVLMIKNWKKVQKEITTLSQKKTIANSKIVILVIAGVVALSLFFVTNFFVRVYLLGMIIVLIISVYLWIFSKAVENVCMIKEVIPSILTDGDWVVHEIVIKGKYICGPKDLGISHVQIEKLKKLKTQGLVKTVAIKYGIPFVPSFLLGFITAFGVLYFY